jgi:hypothetical protein
MLMRPIVILALSAASLDGQRSKVLVTPVDSIAQKKLAGAVTVHPDRPVAIRARRNKWPPTLDSAGYLRAVHTAVITTQTRVPTLVILNDKCAPSRAVAHMSSAGVEGQTRGIIVFACLEDLQLADVRVTDAAFAGIVAHELKHDVLTPDSAPLFREAAESPAVRDVCADHRWCIQEVIADVALGSAIHNHCRANTSCISHALRQTEKLFSIASAIRHNFVDWSQGRLALVACAIDAGTPGMDHEHCARWRDTAHRLLVDTRSSARSYTRPEPLVFGLGIPKD